jgi:hypothetical protein
VTPTPSWYLRPVHSCRCEETLFTARTPRRYLRPRGGGASSGAHHWYGSPAGSRSRAYAKAPREGAGEAPLARAARWVEQPRRRAVQPRPREVGGETARPNHNVVLLRRRLRPSATHAAAARADGSAVPRGVRLVRRLQLRRLGRLHRRPLPPVVAGRAATAEDAARRGGREGNDGGEEGGEAEAERRGLVVDRASALRLRRGAPDRLRNA